VFMDPNDLTTNIELPSEKLGEALNVAHTVMLLMGIRGEDRLEVALFMGSPEFRAWKAEHRKEVLLEAADTWDSLQTPENDHYSRRDTALWLTDLSDLDE